MPRPLLLLIALFLAQGAPAQASVQRYGALFLGSAHIGGADLNDFNPGLGLGWRRPASWCGCEEAFEFGVFYNSYEEIAPYAAYTVSRRIAQPGAHSEVWLGLLGGIARYRELAPQLRREHSIPSVAGYIPVVGLVASWRHRERTDLRLKLVPPGADVDLIVAFSVTRRF